MSEVQAANLPTTSMHSIRITWRGEESSGIMQFTQTSNWLLLTLAAYYADKDNPYANLGSKKLYIFRHSISLEPFKINRNGFLGTKIML